MLVAAAAALALTATGCAQGTPEPQPDGDPAAPAENVSLAIGIPPSSFATALFVGEQEGIFEEAGFDVTFTPTTSMAETLPQLLSGELDYIFADLHNTILAASEGMPIVAGAPIAVNADEPPAEKGFGNLVVAVDSDITSLADLEGKTIGTNSINGQAQLDNTTFLESEGVDTSTIEWVALPLQQAIASLNQGQIDAYTMAEPAGTGAVLQGQARMIGSADAAIPGAPMFVLVATQESVLSDPELAERFQEAVIRANTLTNADRAVADEALAAHMEVPLEVLQAAALPTFAEEPFTVQQVQPVIDRLLRLGLLQESQVPDLSALLPLG